MSNLYLEHARELLGVGSDWQIASWKNLDWKLSHEDPQARMKITGVVAPVLPDGRVCWEYQEKSTKKSVIFTLGEHLAWVRAWELRTGKCSKCSSLHPGQEWVGWNHLTGDRFQVCTRCKGTNQSPLVEVP